MAHLRIELGYRRTLDNRLWNWELQANDYQPGQYSSCLQIYSGPQTFVNISLIFFSFDLFYENKLNYNQLT